MQEIVLKAIEQVPNLIIAVIIIWWFMQRFQEMLEENTKTTEKLYALIENLIERLDDDAGQ